jgi:type I restriction enzyme, S subunit
VSLQTFFNNFAFLADAPNGVAILRDLVLRLAIQGQLVPQEASDEPASKLIERILEERWKKAEEIESKLPSPLPPIPLDEMPFKLPNGWAWERLGNLGDTNIGLTYSPKDISSDGVPVLRSGNIQNGKLDLSNLVRVALDPKPSVLVTVGDLLICARNGSRALVGKAAIIDRLVERTAFGAFMAVFRSRMNPYLYYFIASPLFRHMIDEVSTTTINQITQANLRSTIAPVPPLAEQERIVAKLDELMGICDELDSRQQARRKSRVRLNNVTLALLNKAALLAPKDFEQASMRLSANFSSLYDSVDCVAKLRSTILQLAVQGKLVRQDPKEEQATYLLKAIEEERKKLVTISELKKLDPTREFDSDKLQLSLPEGWAWTRLGEISLKLGAGSTPLGGRSIYREDGIKFLRSQNVWNGGLRLDRVAYVSEEIHQDMSGTQVQPGDVLLNITGASIGRSSLVPEDIGEANVSQHVSIIRLVDKRLRFFIHLCIISPYIQDSIMQTQVGISREGLSMRSLKEFVLPIPPLEEQKRIVAKTNQLMTLCDELEDKLRKAESHSEDLMSAAVQHVLTLTTESPNFTERKRFK